METKHLDANGNGEVDYDQDHDILYFKIRGRAYRKSLDFEDVIVDVDNEGFITGIQIFDASTVFDIDKAALPNIRRWTFNAKIDNKIVTIHLMFEMQRDNVIVERGHDIVREAVGYVGYSETVCGIEA
ncbi:DUF2283 domain-containing protein [Candidatus Woesearchaeota archaeon]|nr:DUF2283 domain-containing protein [Candidatus Woesearchaeota archaeon]